MQTIRIRVNDQIYDKLLWLLKKFRKDEIEVIEESKSFQRAKSDLHSELRNIDTNKGKFLTMVEFESKLDQVIDKYESTSQ